MTVHQNPNLRGEMNARLKTLMATAAAVGSEILRDNLSSTSHGTGVHWPLLPNRSSAPGEMPVMQTGALSRGVGIDDAPTPTGAKIIIEDDRQKLIDLEFAPPSGNPADPGLDTRPTGGRAPMWLTFSDPQTIAEINRELDSS